MLGGALIGLIIGLIMAGVFWYIASQKKPSFDAPVSRSDAFTVALAPSAAIAKVSEAAPAMGLKVALNDDNADRLILEERASFSSYGFFLAISATAEGNGSTITVGLMNKAPQWGPVVTRKHRALVEKIKGALGIAAA
ncbi:MAG TPA: hypothetical protein VM325_17965 [Alphaproteobacteria bacterium]|nr:hypothetical protein [Alphaproteobacteria bacterium]